MPRVAESVIVSYCDFCAEQKQGSRSTFSCELCDQLVCHSHMIELGFVVQPPAGSEGDELSELLRLLREYSNLHIICVECSYGTLRDIVGRLKQERLARIRR